jgi:signal peptidase I
MPNALVKNKKSKLLFASYSAADVLATAFLVLVIVFVFVMRTSWVNGPSMEPTLRHGQILLISAFPQTLHTGDIVVITDAGHNLPDRTPIVKRVLGLPGDLMDFDFDLGTVFVNGAALEEPYIAARTHLHSYYGGDTRFPVIVPPGHCFVLGDNRNDSTDSRASAVGMVDMCDVVGVWIKKK